MQKGDTFEREFILSEEVYKNFILTFQDKNPLHTDEAFAKAKGFASKVMHGNILGGFLSYFIGEGLPTKDVMIYTQEIRYLKPVYMNDRLNFTALIDDVHDTLNLIEVKFLFKNQDDVKVAKGRIQIGLI
jgi:3-hydroxybutyryl-CoA dehydratase